MINTKEQIITLGENLILTKGFNAFSYAHISSVLQIKNAAVHYHFPAKDDLVIAIIDRQIEKLEAFIASVKAKGPEQKLKSFLKKYEEFSDKEQICFVGSFGTDLATLSKPVRNKAKELYGILLSWLTSVLKEGKQEGQFSFADTPNAKALTVTANLAGALQVARLSEYKNYYIIVESILESVKA